MNTKKGMNMMWSSRFVIANLSPSGRFTAVLASLCLLVTVSTAAVNNTFRAVPFSTESDIKLFFSPSPGFLPKPYSVSSTILHESYVVKTVHNGLLWVVEKKHGLYAYRFNEKDEPVMVASHQLSQVGSDNKNERVQDVDFYGNYVYLSVRGADTSSLNYSRVEILKWDGSDTLTQVGTMQFNNPSLLQVVDHFLYVTGNDPETEEGILTEFDLKNDPLHPIFLDDAYYLLPPTLMEYHRDSNQVLLGGNYGMYAYNVNSYLDGVDYCPLPMDPLYFRFLPNRSVLVYGVNTDRSGMPVGQFAALADDGDGNYQIQYKKAIVVPPGKGSIVSDILPLDDRLLISIPFEGLALIRIDKDNWTVEHTEDTDDWIPVVLGEKTVILHQNTAVYNTHSLFYPLDSIDSWPQMGDSGR